jgi:putrescine aminotransferase
MAVFDKQKVVALFERHINRGQVRYLRAGHLDVIEQERSGIGFTDPASGRRIRDCFTSAGCFNAGRHNPVIMAALEEALETMDMGSFHLLSRAKRDLAAKLTEIAPGDLEGVLFASGGGEAVDCALKLAMGATGRQGVLSTVKAYHGHTGYALSANGKEHYRHYCEPLMSHFRFAPFNDLAAMEELADENMAAIIIEPVQGEAGIFPATEDYLKGLRRICDEKGILLLFDEIQTGFCRTGKFFASEHSGIVPDIMTVAKSMGGGLYPNAAVFYRKTPAVMEFLEKAPAFHTTYTGGTDIGCRVSLRVIEFMLEERLWENAEKMGAMLRDALLEIQAENPKIIREVRGLGLMIGIDYCHEFMGPMMADALAKHGVFAAYSGNAPQVMRFMMPVSVTEAEMVEIIAAIRAAVRDMKTLLPLAMLAVKVPGVLPLLNSEKVQTGLFGVIRRIEDFFSGGKTV